MRHIGPELIRKSGHIGVATLLAIALSTGNTILFGVSALALMVILGIIQKNPHMRQWLEAGRGVVGLWQLPLSTGIVGVLSLASGFPEIAWFSLLIVGIADPFAGLAGALVPRRLFGGYDEGKTTVGTLLFLLVAIAIGWPLAVFVGYDVGISFWPSVFMGALCALVELNAPRNTDNFLLPPAAAIAWIFSTYALM